MDIHGAEDTAVFDELTIPRPAARVDMAVVNGRLEGFEIKSDGDSLDRLQRQIDSFQMVFEHMSVVTTERNLRKIRLKIPECWGIIVFEDNENFRIARKSKSNPFRNQENVLFLLNMAELKGIFRKCKNHPPISAVNKRQMIAQIVQKNSKKSIFSEVKSALKRREILTADRAAVHSECAS